MFNLVFFKSKLITFCLSLIKLVFTLAQEKCSYFSLPQFQVSGALHLLIVKSFLLSIPCLFCFRSSPVIYREFAFTVSFCFFLGRLYKLIVFFLLSVIYVAEFLANVKFPNALVLGVLHLLMVERYATHHYKCGVCLMLHSSHVTVFL